MKKLLIIFICFSFTPVLLSMNTDWNLKKTRSFKANNLYGHIDGGAELFLELGFKELIVNYYSNGKSEIVVELYEMESPISALAIYLQKCGKENPLGNVKTRNTGDKFQLSCVKGSVYMTINNSSGNNNFLPDMVQLANKALDNIKASKNIGILNLLPQKNMVKGSNLIFRGMYSLQSIYTFGEGDLLLLKGQIFGAAADYKEASSNYTLLCVKYPSDIIASNAFNNLITHLDNTKKIIDKNKNYLTFRDHSGKFGCIITKGPIIEIKVNLAKIK
jgi:hypothetical protein